MFYWSKTEAVENYRLVQRSQLTKPMMRILFNIYCLVYILACFKRPYLALLPVSTFVFAFVFFHYRRTYSLVLDDGAIQDTRKPILWATECLKRWFSTLITVLFLLRFAFWTYIAYWFIKLAISMFFVFGGDFQERAIAPDFFFTRMEDLPIGTVDLPQILALFDIVLSYVQLLFAYGFYSFQVLNITRYNLHESNPWQLRSYCVIVPLLCYTAYQGEGIGLINILLLTHIHDCICQLQSMLNQSEPFLCKGLVVACIWFLERISFGIFKIGIPLFILAGVVVSLYFMAIVTSALRSIGTS